MKSAFIIVVSFFIFSFAEAQQKEIRDRTDDKKIYTTVEREPEFPGGMEKFFKYLQTNIHLYKKDTQKEEFQASFIFQMIIEKDGRINNVKELRRIPNTSIGKQIIKVIKASPRWQPGLQNGHPVRVRYSFPLHF